MSTTGKTFAPLYIASILVGLTFNVIAQGMYVDFGSRIRTRYMQNVGNVPGGDGETVPALVEKMSCIKSAGAVYFAIDNEYQYQRPMGTANIINVEYFDDSEREIKLVYDSQSEVDSEHSTVITTAGSQTWKSAIFYLDDAYFGDRQKYNADFHLVSSDSMTINVVRVVPIDYYIDFGEENDEYLIMQKELQGGDSHTEYVWVGDEEYITTTEEGQYIYCDVDDNEIFEGDFPEFFISIEYLDTDPQLTMQLQYDSEDEPYKNSTTTSGRGWQSLKTFTWEVWDGYMYNRQNGGSDFRINLPRPGLLINRIFLGYLDYGPSAVRDFSAQVFDYQLAQNFPNPFNPTTTIQYNLAHSGPATLRIYNLKGEMVRTLVDAYQNAGVHVVQWDGLDDNGANTSSGVYFYQLDAENFHQSLKMIKLK